MFIQCGFDSANPSLGCMVLLRKLAELADSLGNICDNLLGTTNAVLPGKGESIFF